VDRNESNASSAIVTPHFSEWPLLAQSGRSVTATPEPLISKRSLPSAGHRVPFAFWPRSEQGTSCPVKKLEPCHRYTVHRYRCDKSKLRAGRAFYGRTRTDSPRSLFGRLKWARSAARKLKIVACNASQTRTPYSRSRNRDLYSKKILTRAGISSLERKSGYQVHRVYGSVT
jgi:hypothetical protein